MHATIGQLVITTSNAADAGTVITPVKRYFNTGVRYYLVLLQNFDGSERISFFLRRSVNICNEVKSASGGYIINLSFHFCLNEKLFFVNKLRKKKSSPLCKYLQRSKKRVRRIYHNFVAKLPDTGVKATFYRCYGRSIVGRVVMGE